MTRIYNIAYTSFNRYEEPVKDAMLEYLVFPCRDVSQSILDHKVTCSSVEEPYLCENSFGFTLIRIRPENFTSIFEFTFKATVLKNLIQYSLLDQLPVMEQLALLESREFYIDNYFYYKNTVLTTLSPANINKIFPYRKDLSLLEFYDSLNAFVYATVHYTPDVTNITTTADEVLTLGKGVCQDFAHLFLAHARSNKLPARYVSGYLNQGFGSQGFAMMHAWVEAFVPGLGWVGFDPTNNLRVDEMYIKVSHGKDYSDCSTIKGVVNTQGQNSTSHQVQVTQQ